jgi:DNA-directed RNA polymerase subunit N (RpoN/RPB10)
MIIPVKCFTCGKVIGNKYLYFKRVVRAEKLKKSIDPDDVIYLTEDNIKKTPEGKCLDDLGLTKICCRRHMLTHVDIE